MLTFSMPSSVMLCEAAGVESALKRSVKSRVPKVTKIVVNIGLGAATLVPYFNVYFSEHYHMSDSALGILFSAGALLTGVACIIGPRLVGNLGGKIRTIVLGQAASLVFLLEVRWRDAPGSFLPENSPFWRCNEDGSRKKGWDGGPEPYYLMNPDNPDFAAIRMVGDRVTLWFAANRAVLLPDHAGEA